MTVSFVHLRLHSEYSLVDGLVRIEELVERAVELGMPAVALTDFSNIFGFLIWEIYWQKTCPDLCESRHHTERMIALPYIATRACICLANSSHSIVK